MGDEFFRLAEPNNPEWNGQSRHTFEISNIEG